MDITKFANPKFVEQFTQRYLLAVNTASAAPTSTSLDQLAVSASGLTV